LIAAVSFPFSEALVSISAGLLLLQALLLGSWNHPSVKKRSLLPLLSLLSIFLVYLLWMSVTDDFYFALYELKKVIFWFIIPVAVFSSPSLSNKQILLILASFVLAVVISSLFSTAKLLLHDVFQVTNFRKVTFISHIRFSFQIILSVIILVWMLFSRQYSSLKNLRILIVIVFFWLTYFLLINKSLLGVISFAGTLFSVLIYFIFKSENLKTRLRLFSIFAILFFGPLLYVFYVISGFYDYKPVDPLEVDMQTRSGNPYTHHFDLQDRENGHLVFVYVCQEELRHEWNKRSTIKYDDNLNGYPLSLTLIRYLASLGYRKDSTGIASLSDKDFRNIEQGITNYKFNRRFFSIYPRIYETVWEMDSYIRSGDPSNKSLAQRIEYLKASLLLIKDNPVFGIGTGNWVIAYNSAYDKMNSKLAKNLRGPSHNQYLNYIVKIWSGRIYLDYGCFNFSGILLQATKNLMFILFLISFGFANFGDANFETHMGLSFFTFFYCMFLWNSSPAMKGSGDESQVQPDI
jgi:hypothetical protein